jgi:hypothetical protein
VTLNGNLLGNQGIFDLYKNWSALNLDILKQPSTVDEAVDRLLNILSAEERLAVASMPQDDLINLHFSLGLDIRNAFDLHEQGNVLLAACGTEHPDDASHVIITALWKKLQNVS